MCGIFGIITSKESQYEQRFLKKSFKKLAYLSESRGKDSSGICVLDSSENKINLLRGPIPVKDMLKQKFFEKKLDLAFKQDNLSKYAFGHSRLVTNGSQLNNSNNQPVYNDEVIGVHNGIVSNVQQLAGKNVDSFNELDTKVLLSIIRSEINNKNNVINGVSEAIKKVEGTVATALVFTDINEFVLATNNGSLYTLINNKKDILFFASELNILKKFTSLINLKSIGKYSVNQILSNSGISINLDSFSIDKFEFNKRSNLKDLNKTSLKKVIIKDLESNYYQLPAVIDLNRIHLGSEDSLERKKLKYPIDKIKNLKRCSKCILPETFPYIYFNNDNVCNYCFNYIKKKKSKSINALFDLVEPYRKQNNNLDILVPLSGGRDSTYALHIIKEELKMNPITYTYDWGMVTDLARRNIARICGKLGVENIIVAADIKWKRQNIKKNILAWLKKPHLGMIPLFMAGDKYFFYYAYKIKKQLGIDLEIWGVNDLENTDFKTGFSGIKPQFDKERIYSLSIINQIKLFSFVGKNFLQSPGYINQSILDTLGSYGSRYFIPKSSYYHLFDYIKWDEKKIENTIINNYSWEKAVDTESTWRIGDGTASFYNYIYNLVAGFTENDTFRSNQIRQGLLSREEALEKIYIENIPRYNSLKWYLEIIGLDFMNVINHINNMKRLY